MIEYLFNAIRARAGEDIVITAKLTNEDGETITEPSILTLSTEDKKIISQVNGELLEDTWYFTIPANDTKELNGRYWYCIKANNESLCFRQPIYLV